MASRAGIAAPAPLSGPQMASCVGGAFKSLVIKKGVDFFLNIKSYWF